MKHLLLAILAALSLPLVACQSSEGSQTAASAPVTLAISGMT